MEVSLISCPVCLKPHFQDVDALRTSLISVAIATISCPVCNEMFLGLDKLTIHLFSHISNNKITQDSQSQMDTSNEIEVEHCNNKPVQESNIFDESSMKSTSITEDIEMPSTEEKKCSTSNSDNICDICNLHFSDETILDLHQKLLHQTSPDKKTGKYNYHCHLCSKQFKMRGSLMVHLRVAHFGYVQSNYRNKKILGNNNNNNTIEFQEELLEQADESMQNVFHDEQQLASEQNKMVVISPQRQVQAVIQLEKPKALNGFLTPKSQDNKQWECEICLKLFTTKYFLKKHKRLHTGEMPYYCSQCNKYFTFQQSYHKHMLYHSDDKPHICSECGRAFKELSTLHNHERIHSGERPFSCETCGKCFRQRVSYLVHRRIHTGVMPYKCTACDKSFRYKVSQRSHKCPVNPPGCVIRTPDLVEKLIEHQNVSDQNASRVHETDKTNNSNDEAKYNNAHANNLNSSVAHNDSEDSFNFLQENFNINIERYLTENRISNDMSNENINNQLKTNVMNAALQPATYNSSIQQHTQEFACSYNENAGNEKTSSTITVSSNNGCSDFFTLILSPVVSDVQSLHLSNCVDTQGDKKQNSTQRDNVLETINEESFKALLYGPTTKQ